MIMKEKETGKQTNEPSSFIEDLTLDEAKAENIKGGPYDAFLKLDGIPGESPLLTTYDLKMAKK
jgi:hypothetical protein